MYLYTHSIVHAHRLHRDVLIDTKQEAISYRSISSRGSLKSTSAAS